MKHLVLTRIIPLLFFGFLLNFGLSSMSQAATVMKASDLIDAFSSMAIYDSINTHLHESIDVARKWKQDSVLGQFKVHMTLESDDYGETYTYITENDRAEAFEVTFHPLNETSWITNHIDRDKKIPQGIYRIPMRLRDVINLMKQDKELLPLLDRLYGNDSWVTGINFTLQKNADHQIFWTVKISGMDSQKQQKTYAIQIDANSKVNPVFHLLRIQ